MAKLKGMATEDYSAKLDKGQVEINQAVRNYRFEAMSACLRSINSSLVKAIESLAQGYDEVGRIP